MLGFYINQRARAGADVVRAREALEALPKRDYLRRSRARKILADALAYYGQCLWDEEVAYERARRGRGE